jgi:hypothetical protein
VQSSLQAVQAQLDPVLERIGHGPQLDLRIGLESLRSSAGAAAATADEAHLQLLARAGMHIPRQRERGQRAGHGERRRSKKIAARSALN